MAARILHQGVSAFIANRPFSKRVPFADTGSIGAAKCAFGLSSLQIQSWNAVSRRWKFTDFAPKLHALAEHSLFPKQLSCEHTDFVYPFGSVLFHPALQAEEQAFRGKKRFGSAAVRSHVGVDNAVPGHLQLQWHGAFRLPLLRLLLGQA